ncbi:hypothetical protein HYW55_00170 [Candidatus Gottesmanbacteria bacterium]|nr:hypothetical protein [Candidatus Gottesmanbacteria bacterium]
MKLFLLFVIGMSILLEATLFPFPLTLVTILIFAVSGIEETALIALLGGLLLDFFSMRYIGVSSIYFLATLFLLTRYSKKVQFQNKFFQLLYLFGATVFYSFLFYKSLHVLYFIEVIVIGSVFLFTLKYVLKRFGRERRLSL